MLLLQAIIVLVAVLRSEAALDLAWENDLDLTSFVTRPEIKAPRFNVTLYDPDRVTPGHWFVAPYTEINQKPRQPRVYHACQTGPHIYDGRGELIYSGACAVNNQNACDFRAWNINGSYSLSAILYHNSLDPVGRAVVMDSSYQVIDEVSAERTENGMNMHEFNLVDNGQSALHMTHRPEYVSTAEITNQSSSRGYIINMGFREVDIRTGETKFQWWAHPEVSLAESSTARHSLNGPYPQGWNWFHGNSADKNSEGDYLVSARYTDTVYKISGTTGKIIWRLGGLKSDFQLLGFNFSRQHDAHWIEEECSANKEVVTLLDNAGDDFVQSSEYSSGLKLELDLESMTASVAQRWIRPDEGRSQLRGNFQRLPTSGNFLAGWSDNGYISEHTPDGQLVMEAEFASTRTVTYRAYKMNFTGQPLEQPVVRAFTYGVDTDSSTTVSYVSWNGATEVNRWHFYNSTGDLIGSTERKGFETRFLSKGVESSIYAEATAADGSVLGRSELHQIELPSEWTARVDSIPKLESFESERLIQSTLLDDHGLKTEL